MARPEKVQAVEEIKEKFESSSATFLTEYRGLSVVQQQTLRRGLRAAGADFKVVKMTLARRAAEELGIEISDELVGPTALAFAGEDPVMAAKALRDFAKENEAFVLKSCLMDGRVLPPEQVSKLAEIEPREVLLARIAGAAKAPMSKVAGMLGSFTRDAASMMSQLLEKKEAEAPAAAVEDAPAEEVVADEPVALEVEAKEAEAPAAAVEDAPAEEVVADEPVAPEVEAPDEQSTPADGDAPEAQAEEE